MPAIDYYAFLGLERSAERDEIKKAYRKLALKHHPEKAGEASKDQFVAISEAYDVLSDAKRRAIYDQYGLEGLKHGVPSRPGFEGYDGGYKYHGNAEETFANFFGGTNPYADFFSVHATSGAGPTIFGSKFGGLHGMAGTAPSREGPAASVPSHRDGPIQDGPFETDLFVTLENLYNGAVKRVKVSHRILNEDQVTTSEEEKMLSIDIKKGWKDGTKVVFPKEGDEGPNRIPADLVYAIRTQAHAKFTRQGDDLHYVTEISLLQALTGSIVELTTLDGRLLKIPVYEIVHPTFKKEIPGEGMPLAQSPNERGKLVISFRTTFPTYFSEAQRKTLKDAFVMK
ncbi:hypothetical protein SeMB42_g02462 [Synchytrium endobioticum]|uniref:J domain-containing protein n=1 Tax=Synchytrium endobioticum TaxID=286115 RepID=A0A507DEH8_9FUNG|nr:hypothetical protein SeLEV6574_g01830 [Synchytrium endobioticum]TPX49821.1 hypothetical protein SeMB42_g02462 [Synchytrium endobioticum]